MVTLQYCVRMGAPSGHQLPPASARASAPTYLTPGKHDAFVGNAEFDLVARSADDVPTARYLAKKYHPAHVHWREDYQRMDIPGCSEVRTRSGLLASAVLLQLPILFTQFHPSRQRSEVR
jgi:hypothetical protein